MTVGVWSIFTYVRTNLRKFYGYKNIKPSNKKFAEGKAKAHEILSYFIVTSNAFKDFFSSEIASKYNVKNIDLELVGNMIIGYVDDPKLAFMTNIINGAFDADKLDYIQRDSHFTGIRMVLDLDRLFHTLDVIEIDGRLHLTVDISVSTLEQMFLIKEC